MLVPGKPKLERIKTKYTIEKRGIKIIMNHNKKLIVFYIDHIIHDTQK
jgi:hypothetical protein